MTRFIEGKDRRQTLLLPESLDEYVAANNPVRVIDAFVDALDLLALGFAGARPAATGRPAYLSAALLRIYLYGYLHRVPSSRRLEQETRRNLELIWLTGQLTPDFKTIADFRRGQPLGRASERTGIVLLIRPLPFPNGRLQTIRIGQGKISTRGKCRKFATGPSLTPGVSGYWVTSFPAQSMLFGPFFQV